MRRTLIIIGCLLCSVATGSAAELRAVVTGPRVALAGDVVDFDSAESVGGRLFAWRIRPDSPRHKVSADGRRIRLAAEPGVYRVQLIVAGSDAITDAVATVLILGEGEELPRPGPGPQPEPGPGPQPTPEPADWNGIAADVVKWASQVETGDRRREAELVADACDKVAERVERGEWRGKSGLSLAQAVAGAASLESRNALGTSIEAWERGCFNQYNARVTALYTAGKLAGSSDWAHMLRATARGLRLVR